MTTRLPLFATLLVALAAAVLTAVATHDVAAESGAVSIPALGWLLPLIIEFAAVNAALLAWRRAGVGLSALPEQVALVSLTALAVTVNAAHATGDSMLGRVLAGLPPLILLGAVELLLRARAQASTAPAAAVGDGVGAVGPQESPQQPAGRPRTAALGSASGSVNTTPPTAFPGHALREPAPTPSTSTDRHALIAHWIAEHPAITGSQVAERLGVSPATGRRLLAAHRERVGVPA